MRYPFLATAFVVFGSASPFAQTTDSSLNPSLLLPQSVHVKGQVVDEDGKPIAGVLAVHAKLNHDVVTSNDGRIEFDTAAPAFVLQLPSYESARLQTMEATDFHVMLHKLPQGPSFRVCSAADLAAKIPGWSGIFQIPAVKGVKATRIDDVDYTERVFRLKSTSRKVVLVQGRGGMWGGDVNLDDDTFWRAIRYREVTYDFHELLPIIDAKAEFPDGTCERRVGEFGETLHYYHVSCGLVAPLDRLLDSVCLIPNAWEHRLE
jgi:hypothetical protein